MYINNYENSSMLLLETSMKFKNVQNRNILNRSTQRNKFILSNPANVDN